MNKYFQNGVDHQEQAKTIEEADRFFKNTCEGWYSFARQKKCGGCKMQATCEENKCPVWQAHQARVDYLKSGAQNIPVQYTSEKPSKKERKPLSWQYRAKKAVIYYLDKVAQKAIALNRKMTINIENAVVQIYVLKDIYLALEPLKNKYPEIYYEAGRRYQKYIPLEKGGKNHEDKKV